MLDKKTVVRVQINVEVEVDQNTDRDYRLDQAGNYIRESLATNDRISVEGLNFKAIYNVEDGVYSSAD